MAQAPITGTFNTSDACEIGYTLYPCANPNAPRIALIHSLALDRSFWARVVAEIGDRAHCLTYDCRGHGKSGRQAITYTPELFARDLAELMDHVQWPAATVAGCSMGGCVAQAFATRYPQRTLGACFIDTTAWYGPEAPKQWRERAATAATKGFGALEQFQRSRWFGEAFTAAHRDKVDALIDVFLANDAACYRSTCEMLGDADLRPLLSSIKAPTAVVVGEEDYAAPVSMAEALHAAIPHSTLTVLRGARHLAPVEQPAEISAIILELTRGVKERSQ
jgi:3-oxoadipate enol-lactonase